jgi:hypothetical protein
MANANTRSAASAKKAATGTRSTRKNATGKKAATVTRPIGTEQKTAQPKTKSVTLYCVDRERPYDFLNLKGIGNVNQVKAAFSIALLFEADYAKPTGTGDNMTITPTGRNGNMTIVAELAPAFRKQLRSMKWVDNAGTKLTADGINAINNRLNGTASAFTTTAALVRQIRALVQKGGKLTHNGKTVDFNVKRTFTVKA